MTAHEAAPGAHHAESHHAHGHHDDVPHGSRRVYLIGFALSALLTAVPFWLVMSGIVADAQATAGLVVALAFVQIVVHTICFLHVNAKSEGGWTLLALIFTIVIIAIVVSGSLWIMYHLDANMMPMGPAGSAPAP